MARRSLRHPLPDLHPGDQLVGRSDGLTGKFIAGWTAARTLISGWGLPHVSHTACIVASPYPADRELWVVESTSLSKLADGVDGEHRVGVQAHHLLDWLNHYPGPVWHAPLAVKLPNPAGYSAYLWSKHEQQIDYDRAGAMRSASWLLRTFRPAKARTVRDTATETGIYCTALYLWALRRGGVFPPPDIKPTRHYPRSALDLEFVGQPKIVKE